MNRRPTTVLQGNIAALRDSDRLRIPSMRHDRFMQIVERVQPDASVQMVQSRSGHTVPEFRMADSRISFHSRYDPEVEAERAVTGIRARGTICVFGFGAAYHIMRVLREDLVLRVLVVCESARTLKATLMHLDLGNVLSDPRLHLLLPEKPSVLYSAFLENHVPFFSTGISELTLSSCARIFPDLHRIFRDSLAKALESIGGDMTTQVRYARSWFRNILVNSLTAYQVPPASLAGAIHTTVVAAGPSAERHFKNLSTSNDFILACDTTAPALLAFGQRADAILCIDPSLYSYHHLLNGFPPGARTILDVGVHPSVWKRSPGRSGIRSGHPLIRIMSPVFDHLPQMGFHSDVTRASVSLALRSGAETVTVVGGDYRWTAGKPYVRGSYIPKLFLSESNRLRSNESRNVDFMFHPHETRFDPDTGDYLVETFAGRREELEALIASRSLESSYDAAPDSHVHTRKALVPVLEKLQRILAHVPDAADESPEMYFSRLSDSEIVGAFVLAPLALRLFRRTEATDHSHGFITCLGDAKTEAIQTVERVHSIAVSRIL